MIAWFKSVVEYIEFVSNRRRDPRYGILPNTKIVIVFVLLVFAALFLTYYFADFPYFDWYYSRLWNQDRSSIFYHTTNIGRSDWMLWSSGGVILFMSIFRLSGASADFIVRWHHLFLKVYFVFTSVAFSGILAVLLKLLIGRARPVATTPGYEVWDAMPLVRLFENTGFPSGHSTSIAAFSMAIYLLAPRIGIYLIPVAVWIGITRLAVGAHFPTDVVAGLILGSTFTWLHARNFACRRLLFEFTDEGRLKHRNSTVKQARRFSRARKRNKENIGLGRFFEKAF
ncbi:MAG: phosphatase PAP2 family protein [Pseudomonadota bacterium]